MEHRPAWLRSPSGLTCHRLLHPLVGKERRKSDFCGCVLGLGGPAGVAAHNLLFLHIPQEEALEAPASARGRGCWTSPR